MASVRDGVPIRIMTYNIHRWAGVDRRLDVDRLAEIIRTAGADIIGLNEVLHPITDGRHVYQPLHELADCLEMTPAFGPSGWIDRAPGWQGAVGNAILSRYPLEQVTNIMLPRASGTKQRSLLGARLSAGPARGLTAYVTHLDHAWEGTRLLQIDGALAAMSRQQQPHFVCGDFNTPGFLGRRSRALLPPVLRRMRRAGYQDAFYAVGTGSGHTFPSAAPLVRFDYLFLPRYWAQGLRTARTVDLALAGRASDHRPVLAEWAWPA